ncbi:MAG: hypothetical protein IGS23_14365 [Rivularia sp. T60_A2020_040]|nr:hypothetical protein [Rivularia sp. T60_A2020_040]
MKSDATPYFLGVAALAVALWMYTQNNQLQSQLNNCQYQFKGFKEGILYSR